MRDPLAHQIDMLIFIWTRSRSCSRPQVEGIAAPIVPFHLAKKSSVESGNEKRLFEKDFYYENYRRFANKLPCFDSTAKTSFVLAAVPLCLLLRAVTI